MRVCVYVCVHVCMCVGVQVWECVGVGGCVARARTFSFKTKI